MSVIATGGITVFRIYCFMSNMDNYFFSTAVEMLISNILDQLMRRRLRTEWMECYLEIWKWIYCRQHFNYFVWCVCVCCFRLKDPLGTAVFPVTQQHGPTSSTERALAPLSVPTIPWWTAGSSAKSRYWNLNQSELFKIKRPPTMHLCVWSAVRLHNISADECLCPNNTG